MTHACTKRTKQDILRSVQDIFIPDLSSELIQNALRPLTRREEFLIKAVPELVVDLIQED